MTSDERDATSTQNYARKTKEKKVTTETFHHAAIHKHEAYCTQNTRVPGSWTTE